MEENTALTLLPGIVLGGTALLVALFKWSASRHVAHEDKLKEKLESSVERHERELSELRSEFKVMLSELSALKGTVYALDTRIAEQGRHWERKLEDSMRELRTIFTEYRQDSHERFNSLMKSLATDFRDMARSESLAILGELKGRSE